VETVAESPLLWRRYGQAAPKLKPNICRNCGEPTTSVQVVVMRGGWEITRDSVTYQGVPIHLAPPYRHLMHMLARSYPHPLSAAVIGARIFYNHTDPTKYVHVAVHQLRKKLGISCPIKTERNQGYVWKDVR